MHHPDGISVQARDEDDHWKEEYNGPQISFSDWSKGDQDAACITEKPGEGFLIKIWFTDFKLHGAEGVVVIVGCGHGANKPGGFEHVQCYWIDGDEVEALHYRTCHYEVWEEGQASPGLVGYTMPAPPGKYLSGPYDDPFANMQAAEGPNGGITITDASGLEVPEGSVVVYVQRANFANNYSSLRGGLRGAGQPRLVTDPPDTRVSKPRPSTKLRNECGVDPIIIARHWFQQLGGEHGMPYIFEFKNLGCVDTVKAQLQLRDDSGSKDADPESDNDFPAVYEDDDGDSGGDYDPKDRTYSNIPTTKKRKPKSSAGEGPRKQRAPGGGRGRKRRSESRSAEPAIEDQGIGEAPDVYDFGHHHRASVGSSTLTMRGRTPAAVDPEEDELYRDSRHPSLYNEPEEKLATAMATEALDLLASYVDRPSDIQGSKYGRGEWQVAGSQQQHEQEDSSVAEAAEDQAPVESEQPKGELAQSEAVQTEPAQSETMQSDATQSESAQMQVDQLQPDPMHINGVQPESEEIREATPRPCARKLPVIDLTGSDNEDVQVKTEPVPNPTTTTAHRRNAAEANTGQGHEPAARRGDTREPEQIRASDKPGPGTDSTGMPERIVATVVQRNGNENEREKVRLQIEMAEQRAKACELRLRLLDM
ncbi:hypothetical protein LTR17_002552 [Elasticomyces elasticus]|nr:hypothetical protein LTR17_002552 [Elasticomyces elasticus]